MNISKVCPYSPVRNAMLQVVMFSHVSRKHLLFTASTSNLFSVQCLSLMAIKAHTTNEVWCILISEEDGNSTVHKQLAHLKQIKFKTSPPHKCLPTSHICLYYKIFETQYWMASDHNFDIKPAVLFKREDNSLRRKCLGKMFRNR